jgi:hypothetical protein
MQTRKSEGLERSGKGLLFKPSAQVRRCRFHRTHLPYLLLYLQKKKKLKSVALVRVRTMPTERPPLVGEVVQTFADRGCCVVSATGSHGQNIFFVVYLTTLSASDGRCMTNWKGFGSRRGLLEIVSRHLLGGTEETR